MRMIVERGTAIAEVRVSDRETPNGYRHVIVHSQADTASGAADLARDVTDMFRSGRETWWRTRLEAETHGNVGAAFVRFSFAMRPGPEHEYSEAWRLEHANGTGLGGLE